MKKTILAIVLLIGLSLSAQDIVIENNDALHVLIQVQDSEGYKLISYYQKDGKNVAVFSNGVEIRKF